MNTTFPSDPLTLAIIESVKSLSKEHAVLQPRISITYVLGVAQGEIVISWTDGTWLPSALTVRGVES